MGYFHPQMIAQAINKPKPHAPLDQMIDFLLAGLSARK
jgi:hypothetical protein